MSCSPRRRLFVSLAALVVVLDQITKFWAIGALTRAFEPGVDDGLGFFAKLDRFLWLRHPGVRGTVTVFDNFWHFRYAENPGAAWSFLAWASGWFRVPFFLTVAAIAMVFIVIYYRRTAPEQRILRVALALVFGGALGNFLDRVRLGYVIDFVDWHWYERFTWPTFNIADAGISIGVALMLLDMMLARQAQPSQKAATH